MNTRANQAGSLSGGVAHAEWRTYALHDGKCIIHDRGALQAVMFKDVYGI